MKRLMAALILLLVFLPSSCDSPVMEPETLTLPAEAQFSTQAVKEVSFPDYVPLIPGLYGTKTYHIEGGSITSQIFSLIDKFTTAVVTMSGISFCVLIRHDTTVCFKDSPAYEVFRSNEFEFIIFPVDLASNGFVNGRIGLL